MQKVTFNEHTTHTVVKYMVRFMIIDASAALYMHLTFDLKRDDLSVGRSVKLLLAADVYCPETLPGPKANTEKRSRLERILY